MRFYVDNSSYFDSHPYSKPRIAKAVASAGGTNIRTSRKNGWRNQPEVVTFTASHPGAKRAEKAVSRALKTSWIVVREKDW